MPGYARVNHAIAQSTGPSTGATTPAKNITGANLIILVTSSLDSSVTVSDGVNTFTPRASYGSTPNVQFWDCYNPTTSASYQASVAGTNEYASIAMLAYSGSASSPFDQPNGAFVSGASTCQPGSVTPGVANELLISAVATISGLSWSIDSGFSIVDSAAFLSGQAYGLSVADLFPGSTSPVNPTWTTGGSTTTAVNIATYKPAAGLGPLYWNYQKIYGF